MPATAIVRLGWAGVNDLLRAVLALRPLGGSPGGTQVSAIAVVALQASYDEATSSEAAHLFA